MKVSNNSQNVDQIVVIPSKWEFGTRAKMITMVALMALSFIAVAAVTVASGGLNLVAAGAVALGTGLIVAIFFMCLDLIKGSTAKEEGRTVKISEIKAYYVEKHQEEIIQIEVDLEKSGKEQLSDQQLDRILDMSDQISLSMSNNQTLLQLEDVLIERCGESEAHEILQKCDFQLDDKVADYKKLLEQVQEVAKRGDLLFDETYLEKKFNISKKIEDLPDPVERRKNLQLIINQAYINHELRLGNRGHLTTGDSVEVVMLKHLGYRVDKNSSYHDKDNLYLLMSEIIANQIRQERFTGSLKFVKDVIQQVALKVRLNAAGLNSDTQIEKFKVACQERRTVFKYFGPHIQAVNLNLPADFPLKKGSIHLEKLENHFDALKRNSLRVAIANHFTSMQAEFKNDSVNVDQFQKTVKSHQLLNEANLPAFKAHWTSLQETNVTLQRKINFFMKWGAYLKKEMVQGYNDKYEALNGGICWGITQSLRLEAQQKGNITEQEFFNLMKIGAKQRYMQVLDLLGQEFMSNVNKIVSDNFLETLTEHLVPDAHAQKFGLTGDKYILAELIPNMDFTVFLAKMKEITPQLQESYGWMSKGFMTEGGEAHETLMRMDSVQNHVWFSDPNFGFFNFDKEGQRFEDAQKIYFDFFVDLVAMAYSPMIAVSGTQMRNVA